MSSSLNWYAELKRSRANTGGVKRFGRLKWVVVSEKIKKVHKIVLEELSLRDIADILKMLEGSIFITSHEDLSMRNL